MKKIQAAGPPGSHSAIRRRAPCPGKPGSAERPVEKTAGRPQSKNIFSRNYPLFIAGWEKSAGDRARHAAQKLPPLMSISSTVWDAAMAQR